MEKFLIRMSLAAYAVVLSMAIYFVTIGIMHLWNSSVPIILRF